MKAAPSASVSSDRASVIDGACSPGSGASSDISHSSRFVGSNVPMTHVQTRFRKRLGVRRRMSGALAYALSISTQYSAAMMESRRATR